MTLSCILMARHNHMLLDQLSYYPVTELLCFFCMVFMFSPRELTLSVYTRSLRFPSSSTIFSYLWTFLMAYSKAKLKTIVKIMTLFEIILNRKCIRHIYLHMWTLPFKHVLIILTVLTGMPNSMRIFYDVSPMNEAYAFSKSLSNSCILLLYSLLFSGTWLMKDTWSVVDLLHQNPHRWSSIISPMYLVHFERRILNTILYAVGNRDIPL